MDAEAITGIPREVLRPETQSLWPPNLRSRKSVPICCSRHHDLGQPVGALVNDGAAGSGVHRQIAARQVLDQRIRFGFPEASPAASSGSRDARKARRCCISRAQPHLWPLSIEKKLWPPIISSIAFTMDSASARSVGAVWMAMRSCMSRTMAAIGSRGRDAMTCVEAVTIVPVDR